MTEQKMHDSWGAALMAEEMPDPNKDFSYSSWVQCTGCGKIGEQIWIDMKRRSRTFGFCTECRMGRRKSTASPAVVTQALTAPQQTAPAATGPSIVAPVVRLPDTVIAQAHEACKWFEGMATNAALMPIVTPEQFQLVGHALHAIKAKREEIEVAKKDAAAPFAKFVDLVRLNFKAPLELSDVARKAWESALARAEAARAAANSAALQAATEAHVRGDDQATAAAVAAFSPPAPVAGVATREVWDFEVCNAGMLPAEYLTPDLPKIRMAMSNKDETGAPLPIPGVKFFQKTITVVK